VRLPVGPAARAELARLLRFALVGLSVAGIYAAGYAGLRWGGLAPWAASALAFTIAVIWQYVAQGRFTFGVRTGVDHQAARFAATIGLGLVISTVLVGWVAPAAGLAEGAALVLVIVWLPIQNYLLFRLWVYRRADRACLEG